MSEWNFDIILYNFVDTFLVHMIIGISSVILSNTIPLRVLYSFFRRNARYPVQF